MDSNLPFMLDRARTLMRTEAERARLEGEAKAARKAADGGGVRFGTAVRDVLARLVPGWSRRTGARRGADPHPAAADDA